MNKPAKFVRNKELEYINKIKVGYSVRKSSAQTSGE